MDSTGLAVIISIIYFVLYFVLLMVLAYCAHKKADYDEDKSFCSSIWDKRAIFSQILLHLFDTATDLGVLIDWGILAQKESDGQEIESIDMGALFLTAITFLILYRLISTITAFISGCRNGKSFLGIILDGFLGLLDMYVLKTVYKAIKDDEEEPSIKQRMLQLSEAIFESLPQVVLQSVFIIRSQNDINLKSSPTLTLVIISLLASLFSIANKYIWADKECVIDEAKQAKSGDSIVNKWYILRILWRFCYVLVRFSIFSMLWSVIGGAFLGIFIPLSWIYWVIIMVYTFKIGCGEGVLIVGYGFVALVASPAFQSYAWAICHGIEMIIALTLITVFATIESIDCGICADPVLRQATNNGYIMAFLIAGWVALPIDFITYFIMLKFERFQGEGETFLTVVSEGVGA